MAEVKIKNLTDKQAEYFKDHLQEEHPITKGKIQIKLHEDKDLDIPEIR